MKPIMIALCIGCLLVLMFILLLVHHVRTENAPRAEEQYQFRMARLQAESVPSHPIQKEVTVTKDQWTEIIARSGMSFWGDVIERNVALEERVDNQSLPYYYVPTMNSGYSRKLEIGPFTSIKIRVAADSPASTGTYRYKN